MGCTYFLIIENIGLSFFSIVLTKFDPKATEIKSLKSAVP